MSEEKSEAYSAEKRIIPLSAVEKHIVDLSSEQEQRVRRDAINTLVLDYLLQLSPALNKEDIEARLWSQGNILTSDIATLRSKETVQDANLPGFFQAVGIARFYWDHPEKYIPDRVVILGKEKDPEKFIEKDEKVLIVVNNASANRTRKRDAILFDGQKREGLRRAILQRPDIYIERISSFLGYKIVPSLFPMDKMCEVTDMSITGAENIIIDGVISGKDHQWGRGFHLALSAKEDIVILPGAIVGEGKRDNISLFAKGNIYQSDQSLMRALRITCHTYVQTGGVIDCPEDYRASQKMLIVCTNEFQAKSGTRPPATVLEIQDRDQGQRKAQSIQEVFDAQQLSSPEV